MQRAVGLLAPGQSAKVRVWREQGDKTVEVKVTEAPDEREARERPGGRPRSLLGLEVRPITPDLAQRFSLKSTEGVVVARVEEGSAAAEAGIQRGDVVKQIKRQNVLTSVRSLADFERATRDVKEGDQVAFLLQRGQMSLYVAFTVGRG
ncbi:MAG: hypothetical protein DME12_14175 [Candidatus Rokuibacteriota bacterium]|nr:MAG: hypothetical protein DME12_14175 [Candidatus Rokubacteria bacterium]